MAEDSSSEKTKSGKPRLHLATKMYKGVMMFTNEVEEIEKMEVKDDDIWVCSFPRSGTTLTQELVYIIQTMDFETATNVKLEVRFPMIDLKDDRFPYNKGLAMLDGMKSPRFIKTHLHEHMLPQPLREGKGKVIYITRNPKDVLGSFYKLLLWGDNLLEGQKSFEEFVDAFIEGKGVYCPWTDHVLGYWNRRNDENVLFIKYEDLVKDIPGYVRKIAKFIGRELSDDDVAKVAHFCHVDQMRHRDAVNLSYYRDFKHVNDDVAGRFINEGKAGTWTAVLTPEMSSKVDKLLKELEGTGLSYDH